MAFLIPISFFVFSSWKTWYN